jgi:DNA-binding CsgD family transcriptional regulator
VAAFGAFLGLIGLVFKAQLGYHSPADIAFDGVGGYLFLGAGVVAHARRPQNRVGLLMVLVGAAFFAEDLQLSRTGWVHTVGMLLVSASSAFAPHLVLAFPGGVLTSRVQRLLVGVAYVAVFVLTPVAALFDDTATRLPVPRANLLLVADAPAVAQGLRHAVQVIGAVVALGVMAVLVRRWSHASLPMRRVLIPVFVTGLVGAACTVVAGLLGSAEALRLASRWIYWMVFCLLPAAFLGAVLRVRLRRSAGGTLATRLGAPLSAADVQAALARALRDPSLQVGWWQPDTRRYVDCEGRPLELPLAGAGRAVREVQRAGRRIAVLVYDPAVGEDEHVLAEVIAVAALALDDHRPATGAPGAPGRSARLDALSRRELDVLALMAKGYSNRGIGKQLNVELKTVETHVSNIYAKLGLQPEPDENRRVRAVQEYQEYLQAMLDQTG